MRRLGTAAAFTCVCLALLATAGAQATPASVPHWSAWLCFPGSKADWCSVKLTTTVIGPSGKAVTKDVALASDPQFDCFYLYPTVSEEARPNSNLVVMPEERETAISQAAYFSHVCRVYAPMYQQVTAYAGECLYGGVICIPQGNYQLEYTDILAAWRDYMAHDNDGRPVILIGHSEGSILFKQLIENVIEPSAERKQIVSAILLGGDVSVDAENRFDGIPACASTAQTDCIVAYSSWGHTPPAAAFMQKVTASSQHVLCVNPAAPGGGSAPITPIFAGINPQGIAPDPSVYTSYPFVEFPDLYTARCVRQGSRAWLLVTRIDHPGDHRPTVQQVLGPDRGFHPADVNLTLANLVALVASQERAWAAHH